MRPLFSRIMQARVAARRDYSGFTVFEFSQLGVAERRTIQHDLITLYEACLLDIGKMSEPSANGDNGYYDIVKSDGHRLRAGDHVAQNSETLCG
jgi:hypothetical protein